MTTDRPWFNPPSNSKAGFTPTQSGLLIPAKEVAKFHENDDLDSSRKAHHHTLGTGSNQALAGDYPKNLPRQQVELTPAQAIPATTVTKIINWLYLSYPGRTNWDYPSPGDFRVPEDGWYEIYFYCLMVPLAGAYKVNTYIQVDGSTFSQSEKVIYAGNYETVQCRWEGNLVKGQLVSIALWCGLAATTHLGAVYCLLNMRKVSEKW